MANADGLMKSITTKVSNALNVRPDKAPPLQKYRMVGQRPGYGEAA